MRMSFKSYAGRIALAIPYSFVVLSECFTGWLASKLEDLERSCYRSRNNINDFANKKFPLNKIKN